MDCKANLGCRTDHGRIEDNPQPTFIPKHRMGPVRALSASTLHGQLAAYGLGQTEQHQHLVDQMRPKIQPYTATRRLAPAISDIGPVSVKAALDRDQLAQPAPADLALKGQEICVVASVMEDGKEKAALFGDRSNGSRIGMGECEGLVHDDGLAGLEGCFGLVCMDGIRSSDDDQFNPGIGEDARQAVHGPHTCKVGMNSLRAAGCHKRQLHSRSGPYERCMEGPARIAVTDQGDPDGSRAPVPGAGRNCHGREKVIRHSIGPAMSACDHAHVAPSQQLVELGPDAIGTVPGPLGCRLRIFGCAGLEEVCVFDT